MMKAQGARIRQARLKAGMTQAALAASVGTRERNIVRWENDQHEPRAESVVAVAKATGVPVEFFYGDDDGDEDRTAPVSLDRALLEVARAQALMTQVLLEIREERRVS